MIKNSYDLFLVLAKITTSYYLYFKEMYLVGQLKNPHSNQNTQASIESYHAALKQWIKIENHKLQGQRMDFLVWRITTYVVIYNMYNHVKKLNGFVLNKRVEKIMANDITKTKFILLEHIRRYEVLLGG